MKRYALIAAFAMSTTAQAGTLFNIDLTAQGKTTHLGFDNAQDSLDSFDDASLEALYPGFNPATDAASAALDYRGLKMELAYLANSPNVTLAVPSLGIDETFSGTTREQSMTQLEDYLTKNGGEILTRINQALARTTPTDPVAGNPGSLMSQMADDSFAAGFSDNTATRAAGSAADGLSSDNTFSLNLRFGQYSLADKEVKSFSLPLAYTVRFDGDPRKQLRFSMPINYATTGEAATFRTGLGMAYTQPITDQWALTPELSYGLTGSVDLGSAAEIRGLSLASRYTWGIGEGSLAMGNMIAKYQTLPLKFDEYNIDSNLSNHLIRNGLLYSVPVSSHLVMDFLIDDTRFKGDELYVQRANEVGVSVGVIGTGHALVDNYLKVGVSYIKTDRSEVDGFRANFGVAF